jgi:flavin-dependent dehydrogenase
VVEFRAPLTLDCSGRDAVAALRNRWRVRDPKLNMVAFWTYYRGALRDPGIDEGATTVAFVPEKGWFWYIPQHEDRVSVGIVAEASYLMRSGDRDPESIFRREAAACRWIEEHLAPGVQEGPFRMTGEYSFHAQHCAADGLVLAGDAFCFLDPVFSSGLMFALKSGVMAADLIDEALAAGEVGGERFADYGARLRRGIENMRKLVYAFYDPGFSFRELTRKYPELAADVTDCLSGDVDKDFTRLFTAVAEFAAVPDPLALGAPSPSRPRERATR